MNEQTHNCPCCKRLHTLTVIGAYDRFAMVNAYNPEMTKHVIRQQLAETMAAKLLEEFPIKEDYNVARNMHLFHFEITVRK